MRGRLEREIRLLPQVLACQVTEDAIVVLVSPSAERGRIERATRDLAAAHGSGAAVRVVGGQALLEPPPPRASIRSAPLMVGSIVGTAVVAASSLLGGLSSLPPEERAPRPPAPAAGPVTRQDRSPERTPEAGDLPERRDRTLALEPPQPTPLSLDDVIQPLVPVRAPDPLDGVSALQPLPALQPGTALAPVRTDLLAAAAAVTPEPPKRKARIRLARLRPSRGSASSASAPASADLSDTCRGPGERGAPRPRRGRHRGSGPRAWSRSVLVPPSDGCGR